MKNKLISTMVIGILTASILNTPTLAKYIQSFKPLKETIVAYEMQKTDVHIQHINKNTNEIIEEEILNDIEIDTVLVSNEYKKDILGYEYDSVESEIVQVSENNNIIKIYYNPITIEENKFDVSINYYEKDTSNKLIESKVLSSQEEGTIINSMDYQVDIDGYVFDSVDKEELIVDKDNTSINFYYKKDNNLPDEITYDVSLVYVDEDNNEIHEREVLPSILENSTIDSSKYILNIEGYEFVKSNPETLIVDKDNNKIVYQYKKIPEVEKYDVTINYYLKDTDNKLRDSIILKDLEKGTMLNSKDYIVKIDGYEYASSNVETVEVIKDEVINLYYIKKDIPVEYSDVTIYHKDIDTNKEILEEHIIKDIEHGTYVLGTDYVEDIEGYTFKKANPEVIKVDKENNSIKLYYEKHRSIVFPSEDIEISEGSNGEDLFIPQTKEALEIMIETILSIDSEAKIVSAQEYPMYYIYRIRYKKITRSDSEYEYIEIKVDKTISDEKELPGIEFIPEIEPKPEQPAQPGEGPLGSVTPEVAPEVEAKPEPPAQPGEGALGTVPPEVAPEPEGEGETIKPDTDKKPSLNESIQTGDRALYSVLKYAVGIGVSAVGLVVLNKKRRK